MDDGIMDHSRAEVGFGDTYVKHIRKIGTSNIWTESDFPPTKTPWKPPRDPHPIH